LGSVRQVINSNGGVVKMYTFNPYGETIEQDGSLDTPWQFTGQYYLRARQYSPYLARFTTRDLVTGKFEEPLSLHKYLYCGNDPLNFIDPEGKWAVILSGSADLMLSLELFQGVAKAGTASAPGPLGISALMEQALLGLMVSEFDAGVEGNYSAGIAFGHGKEGFFFGAVYSLAAGGGFTTGSGVSLTANLGYSNAQKLDDLAGSYTEVGGSVVIPTSSPFFAQSIGGSVQTSDDNRVKTWTVSWGPAWWTWKNAWEGHAFKGTASVCSW
jgi:RHS repeat-associated protein